MDADIKLPMPAEKLVPHRLPFLFVNNLIEFSGDTGVVADGYGGCRDYYGFGDV